MAEFFSLMGPALLACLALTSIYVYFGIHIVRRGVIFVDLALAQVAAMGMTVAFLLGYPLEGKGAYLFSLAFAFFGSIVFAWTREKQGRVSQEATIGIVYAFAAAATVLLVDKAPHGAEHIKYLLVGKIPWVSRDSLAGLLAVVSAVALFHFFFRRHFSLASFHPEKAGDEGVSVPLWDFFFYLSLAWVVTTSVQVAGVLLIFSFLIVPAVCGILLGTNVKTTLLAGWLTGAGGSFVGSLLSYLWDLPTGATIIVTLGLMLFFVAAALSLFKSV